MQEAKGGSEVQGVLEALASPVRREILRLIWDQELPAGEIAAAFALTKPTISQHLGVLRRSGLVTMTATGTFRRYRARQEVLRRLNGAVVNAMKWTTADDLPERDLSEASTKLVVLATVEVDTDQETTFKAFVDPEVYSRWLGVPVTIENGRFACTLEWGTSVRGRYELVCPPELVIMRWDFEDDNVPVPGGEMTGYLRLRPAGSGRGTHVEVHQLVESQEQAEFMEVAWRMVLGRLSEGVVAATGHGTTGFARTGRSAGGLNPDRSPAWEHLDGAAPSVDTRRGLVRRPPRAPMFKSMGLTNRPAPGARAPPGRAGRRLPPLRVRRLRGHRRWHRRPPPTVRGRGTADLDGRARSPATDRCRPVPVLRHEHGTEDRAYGKSARSEVSPIRTQKEGSTRRRHAAIRSRTESSRGSGGSSAPWRPSQLLATSPSGAPVRTAVAWTAAP